MLLMLSLPPLDRSSADVLEAMFALSIMSAETDLAVEKDALSFFFLVVGVEKVTVSSSSSSSSSSDVAEVLLVFLASLAGETPVVVVEDVVLGSVELDKFVVSDALDSVLSRLDKREDPGLMLRALTEDAEVVLFPLGVFGTKYEVVGFT